MPSHPAASVETPDPTDALKLDAEVEDAHYRRVAGYLSRLQHLTSALARARTEEAIAAVIIDEAMPALGAEVGVVAVTTQEGRALRNLGFKGVSSDTEEAWREYSIDSPVPVAEAARRREPVIVETIEERNRRYPVLAEVHGIAQGGAVLAFPLHANGALLGVLAFCYPNERNVTPDDVAFMNALSDQCALAVERTRLLEASAREIEERRRSESALQQTQAWLELALSAGRMAAWEIDLDRQWVTATGSARELWGITEAPISEFIAALLPEDRERVSLAVANLKAGVPYSSEYRIRTRDGRIRWMRSFGTLYEGSPRRLMGATVDITDRKAAEAALEEAARRKDDFVAMLAHELRNPLAPIRNAAELLLRERVSEARAKQLVQVIERQSGHLVRLVDDLLDVSRITRGRLVLQQEAKDLTELVRAVVQDHRDLFESAGLKLEVSLPRAPLAVHADATRLTQAVANLLHNSRKFTDPGGTVRVKLELEAGAEHAQLSVEDTGIGMDEATVRHVFEPLSQADRSLARSRGGIGLGLALVKGLVELHGGSVTATSAGPGEGSRFVIRMPLLPAPRADESVAPPAAPDRLRILVVEDNADAAEVLLLLLELAGHEVRSVASGAEALLVFDSFQPDVVLSDIGLPGELDGYALARALRRKPRAVRLIALSGYGQADDKRRSLQAGFDAHLTKPVDLDALQQELALARGPAPETRRPEPGIDLNAPSLGSDLLPN